MWITNGQLLLVQDGKLYGREPMFAVICKAALLPEGVKNHDIQKNETVAQLGQVKCLPDTKMFLYIKSIHILGSKLFLRIYLYVHN